MSVFKKKPTMESVRALVSIEAEGRMRVAAATPAEAMRTNLVVLGLIMERMAACHKGKMLYGVVTEPELVALAAITQHFAKATQAASNTERLHREVE